jgi:hypothetical protein
MIADKEKRAAEIAKRLKKLYPEPLIELDYAGREQMPNGTKRTRPPTRGYPVFR